jgi:hypothetical protein
MAQLVDMGFDASSAQVALAAAHGDVGAAAASLSDPSAAPPTSSSHNSLNSGGNGASDDASAEAAAPRTYLAASSAWAAVFPLKPYEAASEGRENAPGDFDEATGNGVHSNTTTSLLPSAHDAITCQVRAIRIASFVFAFFSPPLEERHIFCSLNTRRLLAVWHFTKNERGHVCLRDDLIRALLGVLYCLH